jgi:hypothetical protein
LLLGLRIASTPKVLDGLVESFLKIRMECHRKAV